MRSHRRTLSLLLLIAVFLGLPSQDSQARVFSSCGAVGAQDAPLCSSSCNIASFRSHPFRGLQRSRHRSIFAASARRHTRATLGAGCSNDAGVEWPSVSVQIITYNRPRLLAQALEQVAAQDYPGHLEVVVVDDSPASAAAVIERHRGGVAAQYLYLADRRYTIGEKRNLAVANSVGDIICIWDDDDIFPVDRIRQQVSRMVVRQANCSSIQVAFVAGVRPDVAGGAAIGLSAVGDGIWSQFQRCRGLPLPFENSFCFKKAVLQERPFENSSSGEGCAIFKNSPDWYAEAQPISGDELPFLYVRTVASTAPDDALEQYPVRSFLERSAAGFLLDQDLFALARSLRRKRFPSLASFPAAGALDFVKLELEGAIKRDVHAMREDGVDGLMGSMASGYLSNLGGLGPADPPGPDSWVYGDAGEAPEGSVLLAGQPAPPLRRRLEEVGSATRVRKKSARQPELTSEARP
mmetsp:Transcript_85568/g.276135  ORF Transcript_85568/g.276135 Transcript_85568/m.276135 type:complete len:465 (+) Transcript_85568:125-1519(+)